MFISFLGIGAATAARLSCKGALCVLAFNSNSSRPAVEALAATLPTPSHLVQADLSKGQEAAEAIVAGARALHDAHLKDARPRFQIDIVINNAGVIYPKALNDPSGPITVADFNAIYSINVIAPMLLVQAVQPHLPTNRSGRIVNVSSAASRLLMPGFSIYSSSKAALEALTRIWSAELAGRATVNAVNPGPVWTDMTAALHQELHLIKPYLDTTPLAQYGAPGQEANDVAIRATLDRTKPGEGAAFDEIVRKTGGTRPALAEEIAGIIEMLCCEGSGWSTGGVIGANGGMVCPV